MLLLLLLLPLLLLLLLLPSLSQSVLSTFPLRCRLREDELMSRCNNCNAADFRRISHEAAAAHVTIRLLDLVDEFWQCGK
jgi:uncharacterized protein with PIN domain